ncbi:hypothetical protein [Flavihumibacter petaseus]|nr:hypothetical protein [Flavihumibacter petaseus]
MISNIPGYTRFVVLLPPFTSQPNLQIHLAIRRAAALQRNA